MKKMKKIEAHILIAAIIIVIIIGSGTIFYKIYEQMAWLDAFYLTAMTIITIGYGDFHPSSNLSKIVTIFYSLISVPTILFCLGLIIEDFFENRVHKLEGKMNKMLVEEKEILKEEKEILEEDRELRK
ncbi:MAG: potassium channel family protein [Candidatus Berkelbacteria bacterium]